MYTVPFNLITLPFATSNNIRITLFKATDPLAPYATMEKPAPHPKRQWHFLGLPRVNYRMTIEEVDPLAETVIQLYTEDWITVPAFGDLLYKNRILLQVGQSIIPGTDPPVIWPANVTHVNIPDWIGWTPIWSRPNEGLVTEDKYNWNPVTGDLDIIEPGVVYQPNEYIDMQFEPIVVQSGGPLALNVFSDKLYISNTYSLSSADAGKKIFIKGAVPYFEVSLPDITTATELEVYYIESTRGGHQCVTFRTQSGQVFDLENNTRSFIRLRPNERLEFYKEAYINPDFPSSTPVYAWRVHDWRANLLDVGEEVATYKEPNQVYNNLCPMNGAMLSVFNDARLYDEVLLMPATAVVSFEDWPGDKTKYSYADSNPASATYQKFFVPEVSDLFSRNADPEETDATYKAGKYGNDTLIQHGHKSPVGSVDPPPFGNALVTVKKGTYYGSVVGGNVDLTSNPVFPDGHPNQGDLLPNISSETAPKHHYTNKYVKR